MEKLRWPMDAFARKTVVETHSRSMHAVHYGTASGAVVEHRCGGIASAAAVVIPLQFTDVIHHSRLSQRSTDN